MSKFEQIGVNIQHESISKEDSVRRFKISCDICCCRGMKIDCDRCSIAVAHRQIVAIFDEEGQKDE